MERDTSPDLSPSTWGVGLRKILARAAPRPAIPAVAELLF